MTKIKTITIKAPLELAIKMRVEAAKRDMSMSAAIREAMRMWLEKQKIKDADDTRHSD